MLNRLATLTAAVVVIATSSVFAQPLPDRGHGARPPMLSREDAGAYLEARISALHSGLQLTPEQERLWPAFEQAYRESAKVRLERGAEPPVAEDPMARMQRRADALTRRAAAAKALAEAAVPLWQSFGDGQKRRFAALARPSNFQPPFGGRGERGVFGGDRAPRGFGPGGPGRDGDFGPRRFGFGGPGRDGDYGRGTGNSGPEGRGRDGDGYGLRGQRDFGGRDRDYGYGGRPGFGSGRDRDYRYGERQGFEPRGFGRDDDYGQGERRGFGPGRPDRDDRRDFGRGFGRDFGGPYRRGRLPWWHPDIGGFRTLDEPDTGERGGADEQI
jgi:zinc resistance-associated protein